MHAAVLPPTLFLTRQQCLSNSTRPHAPRLNPCIAKVLALADSQQHQQELQVTYIAILCLNVRRTRQFESVVGWLRQCIDPGSRSLP